LGRQSDALAAFERVVSDYGTDPPLRLQVVMALIGSGTSLLESYRPTEALDTYQRVISDYASDPDPDVGVLVVQATRLAVVARAYSPDQPTDR